MRRGFWPPAVFAAPSTASTNAAAVNAVAAAAVSVDEVVPELADSRVVAETDDDFGSGFAAEAAVGVYFEADI